MGVTPRLARVAAIVLVALTAATCGDGDGNEGGGRTVPALPDLAITSATVARVSDQSCGGAEICLIVTVANVGTAPASGFTDGCGTSTFGDPEPWTQYVGDGIVPPGARVTYRSAYPGLAPHLPATFTLFCEVDAADVVAEIDETNNTYTATVSL